jgi:SNF2 family DNA or RNA helicase
VRNRSSETFAAACALQSTYRWCLTGTPIHNSLDDYGALLSFLRLPHLDSKKTFGYWIGKPVFLKQPHSLERLQTLIRATCLRRTKDLIQHGLQLPPKMERVQNIELSQEDKALYEFFKNQTSMFMSGRFSNGKPEKSSPLHRGNILSLINILRRLCDGGTQMLPREALNAWRERDTMPLFHTFESTDKKCHQCGLQIPDGSPSEILGIDGICDSHSFCDRCLITLSVCSLCERDDSSYNSYSRQKTPSSQEICTATPTSYPPSKVQALLANLKAEQQQNCVSSVGRPSKR